MNVSQPHGFLVIDKPAGITSRRAVDIAAKWLPRKTKIGHTGTLDPLATGVLVLCVGRATRLATFVQEQRKTYVAEIVLGARSLTLDGEGPITPTSDAVPTDRATVECALAEFVGEIEQIPPAFSAVKSGGTRSYALARRGLNRSLPPRPVRIFRIDLLEYAYPALRIEVECGKGTYLRSLARDLGERIDCGGYLASLRRTRVGSFLVDDALPLDSDPKEAVSRLIPMTAAVSRLPAVWVSQQEAARLRHGNRLRRADPCEGDTVAVFDESGEFIAVAQNVDGGAILKPSRVFSYGD
jgi:tRNA pseudouridine55 synthase